MRVELAPEEKEEEEVKEKEEKEEEEEEEEEEEKHMIMNFECVTHTRTHRALMS